MARILNPQQRDPGTYYSSTIVATGSGDFAFVSVLGVMNQGDADDPASIVGLVVERQLPDESFQSVASTTWRGGVENPRNHQCAPPNLGTMVAVGETIRIATIIPQRISCGIDVDFF